MVEWNFKSLGVFGLDPIEVAEEGELVEWCRCVTLLLGAVPSIAEKRPRCSPLEIKAIKIFRFGTIISLEAMCDQINLGAKKENI